MAMRRIATICLMILLVYGFISVYTHFRIAQKSYCALLEQDEVMLNHYLKLIDMHELTSDQKIDKLRLMTNERLAMMRRGESGEIRVSQKKQGGAPPSSNELSR